MLVVALLAALLMLGVVALWRYAPVAPRNDSASRLADWDRRVRDMPQHADLRSISDRLTTVERVCDVVRSEMSGVKEAVGRIERLTNMLIAEQIETRRGGS